MTTLRGITWDHPRGYGSLVATTRQYEREREIHVEWDARSLRDFGGAPLEELARHYDMLVIDHPHVGDAAESHDLCALDEVLPQSTLAALVSESIGPTGASYRYGGRTWALPLDAAHHVAAYRPDLLDEAPPETWRGILDLARRLLRAGRPLALPLAPTDCICSFMTLCASQGSPPGHGGRWVDHEIGAASLAWLREAAALANRSSLTWNPIQCLDHMAHSNDVPYCPVTFGYVNYAWDREGRHPLRYTHVPGGQGALLGGAGFAVSSHSAHRTVAAAYGAWLCSAAIQAGPYVASEGQPANRAAWVDERANDWTNGFFADTRSSMEEAYVRPRHPGFVPFQTWAGKAIHAFLDRDEDAASLLEKMDVAYGRSWTRGGSEAIEP